VAEEKPKLVNVLELLIDRLTRRRHEFDFTIELKARDRPILSISVKGWSVRKPVE